MPAPGPNQISHEVWAERLEDQEKTRAALREGLVQSLKQWMREQIAKAGTLHYFQLPSLADHFPSGQINHDVLLSVAEDLVQDGVWITASDAEHGDHWAPNPDFDPQPVS